jgi:hypothetical protein
VDQKVTIEVNGKKETSVSLAAGIAQEITL